MTHRIIDKVRQTDDAATHVHFVCVQCAQGRVHIRFSTSAYDDGGFPFINPNTCATGSIEMTPCNCDDRCDNTPPWVMAVVNTYLERYVGQSVTAVKQKGGRVTEGDKTVWGYHVMNKTR